MFKFLKKLVFIIIGLSVVYVFTFRTADYILNNKSNKNAIFIWGDSQTNQGIDLGLLKKLTGYEIYSTSQHGAGVYDFFVFAENVPKNSIVIAGYSVPLQIRKMENDKNTLGLSLTGIKNLYENHYSLKEISLIFKKNITAKKLYTAETNLFPVLDTIVLKNPKSHFIKVFSSAPEHLPFKQNIYFEALKVLKMKSCQIILVKFPLHKDLNCIFENSQTKTKVANFENMLINSLNMTQKIITYRKDKNIMYDYTHYNSLGAVWATQKLYEECLTENYTEIQFLNLLNK